MITRSAASSSSTSASSSSARSLGLGRVEAEQPPVQGEQLAAGLARVEARLLQRDADPPRGRRRGRAATSTPGDLGAAGGDRQQRRQHPHGRRLAGAVRAEEAEDLAGADLEVDAADGLDRALAPVVVLDQPLGQHGRAPVLVHLRSCSSRISADRESDRGNPPNSSPGRPSLKFSRGGPRGARIHARLERCR